MLDYWQKDGGLPYIPSWLRVDEADLISGMGQLRHFFRVAVHGLEKGVVPTPKPELVSRIYRSF